MKTRWLNKLQDRPVVAKGSLGSSACQAAGIGTKCAYNSTDEPRDFLANDQSFSASRKLRSDPYIQRDVVIHGPPPGIRSLPGRSVETK
jgi:hypothetical protein